jgi:hypothetical protein
MQTKTNETKKTDGASPGEAASKPVATSARRTAHHEDFARRRLLHEAVGFPDEPPFHIGFDLMTTLESDDCGGTDADPTDTLLKRAIEQIHIAQELDDDRIAAAEASWIKQLREKGIETHSDRTSIRRMLAKNALSLAEGLVDHAQRLHQQQADFLTRHALGQAPRDRLGELGFDERDPEHAERVAALKKAGLL